MHLLLAFEQNKKLVSVYKM